MNHIRAFLPVTGILLGLGMTGGRSLPHIRRWVCYYGDDLREIEGKGLDLAILNGAVVPPHRNRHGIPEKTLYVGYVSLGEAEECRSYWEKIKGRDWILEPNQDWGGDHRVDVRSQEWQHLILEHELPSILQRGYRGLFLDTLDTAVMLEQSDPTRFAGAQAAMVRFVRAIRHKFPSILLICNRGFEFLHEIEDVLDFLLVESVFGTYDFKKREYIRTPAETRDLLISRLNDFADSTGKPVLTLDYSPPDDTVAIQALMRHAIHHGFIPYVANIELNRVYLY